MVKNNERGEEQKYSNHNYKLTLEELRNEGNYNIFYIIFKRNVYVIFVFITCLSNISLWFFCVGNN